MAMHKAHKYSYKHIDKMPYCTTAKNWQHLLELLFNNTLCKNSLRRYRSNEVFRGVSNVAYKLESSLERLHPFAYKLEDHLLRNFIKYSEVNPNSCRSHWMWVAIAQHHGLPTRLIDWTMSPLVALHFATANTAHFNKDGAIWCIDTKHFIKTIPRRLQNVLNRNDTRLFTVDILDDITQGGGYPELANYCDDTAFAILFEPPSLDVRIASQQGLFSVFSTAEQNFHSWMMNHPEIYRIIKIPSSIKWEVRDKLDHSNVNERVLFPGLDGLCSWLKRHYRPIDELVKHLPSCNDKHYPALTDLIPNEISACNTAPLK